MVKGGRRDLADHFHFSEMDLGLFSATWISVTHPHNFFLRVK